MRWIVDDDGDIGITFWNICSLVKYKNSVVVFWFKKFEPAPKYYGLAR